MSPGVPAPSSGAPLVLRDGVALVGPDLDARPFETLTVVDGRIAGFDEPDRDADVVDLGGGWVVPGLVDAHVHLDLLAASSPFDQWRAPAADRIVGLVRNGLVALASGTLTLRDLGSVDHSVIDYARLVAGGRLLGPNVVAAGRFVAMTGGHLWAYARVADGPHEVRTAVREEIRAGAGVIKVMATGGLTSPGAPGAQELEEDELRVAVREAAKAGLRVAAHAHGAEGVRAAVAAGAASVEHGAYVGPGERELLRATGVALVPTLSPVLRLTATCGVDGDVFAKTDAVRPTFTRNIAAAIAEGVRIVAGTDAGCAFNPVGHLVDELTQYVALGMTPYDALRSGTVWAGELLGTPGTGRLEVGGPADMVVVGADPRADLAALRSPSAVVRAGRSVDLAALEMMIEALGGRDAALPAADAAAFLPVDTEGAR